MSSHLYGSESPLQLQTLRDCLSLVSQLQASSPVPSRRLDQLELRILWLIRQLHPEDWLSRDQLRASHLQRALASRLFQQP